MGPLELANLPEGAVWANPPFRYMAWAIEQLRRKGRLTYLLAPKRKRDWWGLVAAARPIWPVPLLDGHARFTTPYKDRPTAEPKWKCVVAVLDFRPA